MTICVLIKSRTEWKKSRTAGGRANDEKALTQRKEQRRRGEKEEKERDRERRTERVARRDREKKKELSRVRSPDSRCGDF